MAEEKPSLHIDTDWKRQAQEEKKRLAEQEAKKAKEAPLVTPTAASVGVGPAASAARSAARPRPGEAMPAASFATLVQSLLTQTLFYLGDLATRGSEPSINLDMAKHQLDSLGILEEKTKGNLSEEEQRLIDTALYETRMRFVNVSSQFIT